MKTNTESLIDKALASNASDALNEYLMARNVHTYKTRNNFSKEITPYFKGWKPIVDKPAAIKVGKQTQMGLFLFSVKYGQRGVEVEAFWPKQLGSVLSKGLIFNKRIIGQPVENSFGFKLTLPVENGAVFKNMHAVKSMSKIIAAAAKRAETRWLDTSEE